VPPAISMPPDPVPAIVPENSVEPAVITKPLLPSWTKPLPANVLIALKGIAEPEISNVPLAVTTLEKGMPPRPDSASVAPGLIVVAPV